MSRTVAYTRKLRAIAVVDLVGYSRLMSKDEARTHQRVSELFEVVVAPLVKASAGQTVERAGDGLIILFESSSEAVGCAIAIQKALMAREQDGDPGQRLEMRIGVNIGDIIFDGSEIAGDDLNIAVRLQAIAEPGGICMSAAVKRQLREPFDVSLADWGEVRLKNIGRPVHVYALGLGVQRRGLVSRLLTRWQARSWVRGIEIVGAASGVASLLALGFGGGFLSKDAPAMSLAVPPFEARGFAAEEAATTVTEVVTRGLARTSWLQVSAPNVARRISGAATSVSAVGRELRVRYVVSGAVARAGDGSLTVDVELIDVTNGITAWAQRIPNSDGPDLLAQNLVVLLREAVYAAEARRLFESGAKARTPMEHKMLGDAAADTHFLTLESDRRARKHYEDALILDPEFAPAMLSVAYTLLTELDLDPDVDRNKVLDRLDTLSKRIIAREPSSAPGWQLRAETLARHWRWDAALEASDRSLALDPARAFALAQRADMMVLRGRPSDALSLVDKAAALAEQRGGYLMLQRCRAQLALGLYRAAIGSCQRSVSQEEWWLQHAYLLAAYALIEDDANTRIERDILQRMFPGVSISRIEAGRLSNDPLYAVQIQEHLYRGLRKASIPEGP